MEQVFQQNIIHKNALHGKSEVNTGTGFVFQLNDFKNPAKIKSKERRHTMGETKTKDERYNEARVLHKSLDDKLQILQAKHCLTDDEELEIKLLKKNKLYYKDLMEKIKEEP